MKARSLAPLRSNIKPRIKTCEQIIGYTFRNPRYIREALSPLGHHNQRLGLVGDRVLDAQLVARWYDDKRRLDPSQWHIVRNALVNNRNLAEVGSRLRIQDCTLTPGGTGGRLATTVEAIIGAVWLDSKCDYGAVSAVMERLSLTKHPLIRSPRTIFTTSQPAREIQDIQSSRSPKTTFNTNRPPRESHHIQSSRSLPGRFFVGHHVGLLELLFRHSQPFIVQLPSGQHGAPLSRHEPVGEAATDGPPTGEWSAPQITSETVQKRTAARIAGKHKHRDREPSPSDTTTPPKRQAPAHKRATGEQINAEHDDSALDSALPVQQPVNLGDHSSTLVGRHYVETEWGRLKFFLWTLKGWRSRGFLGSKNVRVGLYAHREVLLKLPGQSLRNVPDGFSTDGVYLMTRSAHQASDRLLAQAAGDLWPEYYRLAQYRERKKSVGLHVPEVERDLRRVERQLVKVGRARLKLWLPQDAQQRRIPVSLPDSGQTSATSPATPQSGLTATATSTETPESGLPATAAVDPTRVSTAAKLEHKHPHRPGSVLWTTHTAQQKSVDWKQYLSKPTSEN